jgi:NADH-ubiquinone oxidoreductase chain 6
MFSLFLLNETFTNGYKAGLLNLISLAAILCGIAVIIAKNPIISVLFLIGLFLSISSYLLMLGINYIGISYLLVYVGAVSILFLFILMLINVRISELLSYTNNSIPLAIILGISFNYPVYQILPNSVAAFNSYTGNINHYLKDHLFSNDMLNMMYSNFTSLVVDSKNAILKDSGEIAFVTSKL